MPKVWNITVDGIISHLSTISCGSKRFGIRNIAIYLTSTIFIEKL